MRPEDFLGHYVLQEGPENTAFTMAIENALERECTGIIKELSGDAPL